MCTTSQGGIAPSCRPTHPLWAHRNLNFRRTPCRFRRLRRRPDHHIPKSSPASPNLTHLASSPPSVVRQQGKKRQSCAKETPATTHVAASNLNSQDAINIRELRGRESCVFGYWCDLDVRSLTIAFVNLECLGAVVANIQSPNYQIKQCVLAEYYKYICLGACSYHAMGITPQRHRSERLAQHSRAMERSMEHCADHRACTLRPWCALVVAPMVCNNGMRACVCACVRAGVRRLTIEGPPPMAKNAGPLPTGGWLLLGRTDLPHPTLPPSRRRRQRQRRPTGRKVQLWECTYIHARLCACTYIHDSSNHA